MKIGRIEPHYLTESERMSAILIVRLRQKDREEIDATQKELGHPTLAYTVRYLLSRALEEK